MRKSKKLKKTAAVIGLWHLGCTVAASLAKAGFKVQGFDFDPRLINKLNKSQLPIKEPGLAELTKQMIDAGRLTFTTDFSQLKNYPYIIVGYDTPVGEDDRTDLAVLEKAVAQIAKFSGPACTVIIMSQVPAGTSRRIYKQLANKIRRLEVVYNPENLRLSQAIETYLNADRQVIGVGSSAAKRRMEKFYSFYKKPLMFMSLESAELVKHGVNSFLATSVSYINQLSDLSEAIGCNIMDVVKGLRSDSRIGQKAFLSPGLGFAGGTLGRDLRALEFLAKKFKVRLPLISNVYEINRGRKEVLYKKIKRALKTLKGKRLAILGLVYKPGTNTLRRSLSLEVGKWLVKQGAQISGYDPSLRNPSLVLPIKLAKNLDTAVKNVDAIVIITEWPEFKKLNYKKIKKFMRGRIIFDTKNILSKREIEKLGYEYFGTGV